MTRSLLLRNFAIPVLLIAAVCGMTASRPAAHAAPAADKADLPTAPAPASLASLLSGKTYPLTLKADQVDAAFQMVDLVDTQGKPGTYATKGETATVGGETFLVSYFVVPAPGQSATATIPPGSTLRLAFINMRYLQAMVNPHPAVAAP